VGIPAAQLPSDPSGSAQVEKEGVNMDTDIGELIERAHVLVDRRQTTDS
jgi:hypothetical protein